MIVADTHIVLWWFSSQFDKLSHAALDALEREKNGGTIYVSSITAWEIAILVERGRIGLDCDVSSWLAGIDLLEAIRFVPIDNEIAVRSTQLGPEFHKDPADRFIVATCLKLAAPLVTADSQIHRYPLIRTIW